MKCKRISLIIYVVVSVILLALHGLINRNYDSHMVNNYVFFIVLGISYLAYIPWTVIAGYQLRKDEKTKDWFAVSILYALYLIFVYFVELSQYCSYLEVINHFP